MVNKKYCAAPWITGMLQASGRVIPCCYAPVSFGDWLDTDLKTVWHSDIAIKLRQATIDGEFINDICRSCHNENRAHTLTKLLNLPFNTNARVIGEKYPKYGVSLRNLRKLFTEKEFGATAESIISQLTGNLCAIEIDPLCESATHLAISKIRVIVRIIQDFLQGNNKPVSIAPFRSTTVIGICNSRCVQCPMKYSGEIQHGFISKDGTRKKYVDQEQLIRALTPGEDILSFVPMASELLLYPHWKDLVLRLHNLGVQLRLATNGMALRKEYTEFLIDNAVIATMTFSIDASSKSIYENLRVNLVFERVVENIKYFFSFAAKKEYKIHVGFSFCLMNRNYSDLPGFIDIVDSFRQSGKNTISVGIGIHSLQLVGPQDYLKFMKEEHHSTIDPAALGNSFAKMQERADALEIQVTVFNKYQLNAFNKKYLNILLSGDNPFSVDGIDHCFA